MTGVGTNSQAGRSAWGPVRAGWGRALGARRRGISLAEMMVAIVILGLGLIMVATLFPVSWMRARELAEFTNQNNITDQAESAIRLTARVDGRTSRSGRALDALSFKGDQILFGVDPGNPNAPTLFFQPNVRVHAMNLENLRYDQRAFVAEDPWKLDPFDEIDQCAAGPNLEDWRRSTQETYFQAQVRLYDRVYPPMRPRADELDFNTPDPLWDAVLDARRYCWAAFHKLSADYVRDVQYVVNGVRPACPPISAGGDQIGVTREFTMYYVTLRRPRATQRFARQDARFVPDYRDRATPVRPRPMASAEDLMFPVAWRVQITLPDDKVIKPKAASTGVPTEVGVNVRLDMGLPFWSNQPTTAQMFRTGTVFIDELNGQVYRVEKRRLGGANDEQAFLTLDREIILEDVDDFPPPAGEKGKLDDQERLRVVWVFPPSVRARVNDGDPLVFDGAQPVVGVDIRTLALTPPL